MRALTKHSSNFSFVCSSRKSCVTSKLEDTIPATARKFAVLFQEGEPEVEGYLLKYMGDKEIRVARPESCGYAEGIVAPSHKDIFVVTWEKTDLRWTIPNIRSREDEFAVVRFPGSGARRDYRVIRSGFHWGYN